MLLLSLTSLFFGFYFLRNISFYTVFIPVPLLIKLLPSFLLVSFFLLLSYSLSLFTSSSQFFNSYFSRIMFLYFFMTKFSRNLYYSFSFNFVKTIEIGFLNDFLNVSIPRFFFSVGSKFLRTSIFNPLYFSFLCLLASSFFLF